MFDYEAFANEMYKQSLELIPPEFSNKEKEYISTTISDFVKLAGESLNNDKENNFSDEQKVFIAQVIAEWTFHKSVDLIRAEISDKYWDGIMQKIAFTIFEIIKQALLKDMPKEQILETVEYQVQKVYKEIIEELHKKNVINNVIKDFALAQSNIDKMSYSVKNETEQITDTSTSEQEKRTDSSVYLIGGIIGLITLLLTLFIISHFNISLPRFFDNRFFAMGLSVSIFMIIMGYFTWKAEIKNEVKTQMEQLEDVRQKMQDLVYPNRKMYERLGCDVIRIEVGQGLLCLADPDNDISLLAKIAAMHLKNVDNYGYIYSHIRIIDSEKLQKNEYSICIRNQVVDEGFVYPNKYMVILDQWNKTGKQIPDDAIKGVDPTYKTEVIWISEDDARGANDITAVAPNDVIIAHLAEVLIQQVDKVLTEKDVAKYIALVNSDSPIYTENLMEKLSYSDIRRVFVNLIKEKVSIKDICLVLSRLEDYSRFNREPDILSERLRKDLSRQICLVNCTKDKKIFALGFSSELLENLTNKVEKQTGFNKTQLKLDFDETKNLVETTANTLMKAHQKIGQQPIILVNDELRLPLYRLLVKHIPSIVVLSTSEIEQDIKLEIVDTIK